MFKMNQRPFLRLFARAKRWLNFSSLGKRRQENRRAKIMAILKPHNTFVKSGCFMIAREVFVVGIGVAKRVVPISADFRARVGFCP